MDRGVFESEEQQTSEKQQLACEMPTCWASQGTHNEVESSRNCYAALYDSAPVGYLNLDEFGRISKLNPMAAKLFGRTQLDLVGRPLLGFIVHTDLEKCMEYINSLRKAMEQVVVEAGLITADGTVVQIQLISMPSFRMLGSNREFWSVMTDVTEKRNLEIEMFRLERLNLVGEMAAGIAHEIRNPMTTVRGFLQILGSKPQYAVHQEYFDIMVRELDRANSIITNFLSLAKNKLIHRSRQDLNAIIEILYPLLSADALLGNKNIKLNLGTIPSLLVDDKEIHQLVLNIACNGLQAMQAGGWLTIETYCEDDAVVLAIHDQGSGINQQMMQHLGTPFLTTKENGTGLGLAICYSIVARHAAKMEVTTSSQGTSFFIRFPYFQER